MSASLEEQIDDLRLEAEAVLLEMSLMLWRSHEYGDPVDIRSVLRGHERLTSADSVRLVRRAIGTCENARDLRALEYLLSLVAGLFVGDRTARLYDRLENGEMKARVRLDGRSVPFRALSGLIANEPDPGQRRQIHALALDVTRKLNPQRAELWRLEHALPREVGYGYTSLSEMHRHVRLRDVAVLARQALDRTEKLYLRLLDEQSRALLGFGADRLRRSDVPRLMRNTSVEDYFPARRLVPTAERTVRGMGFDVRRMDNLRIFAEDRPNKAPRACCCPLKVPGDVRLTVRPIGGGGDYETLLHELGHGLHFAMTRTDRFEFQHLGGGAVTETYAFLLEHLIENRSWLRSFTRMPEREVVSYLRFRAFAKLYRMRRYAAKILYEIHFHKGGKKPRDAYRRLLSRAYGFDLTRHDAVSYLADIDPTFYAADYFRAWMLEAMLVEQLERRFGTAWFERKGAGRLLARLWATGNEMTADDLLARLGKRRLSLTPWMGRVRLLLRA